MYSNLTKNVEITNTLGAGVQAVPREFVLDTAPKGIAASHKIVSLPPMSSSAVNSNQTIQFNIPQRAMLRAHSVYLKFAFTPTTTAPFSFAGSAQSAASVINSLQLQCGGVVVENLLNYGTWHNNIVLAHGTPGNSMNVESICSGGFGNNAFAGTTYNTGTNAAFLSLPNSSSSFPITSQAYNFSVPLYCGLFNNTNSSALPLFAMNGGVLLTIQTNPITKAVFASGAGFTEYALSNLELIYDEISPEQSYIDSVRASMAAGKVIKLEQESYLNFQVSNAASVRQLFNMNVSSLNSLFWGVILGADAITTSKWFQASTASTPVNDSTNIRQEIYLDNILLFNGPNQSNLDAINYRELQKAICSSVSDHQVAPFISGVGYSVTQAAATNNGTYRTQAYAKGLLTKLSLGEDTSMNGTPVQQLTISFQDSNTIGTDTLYFYNVYSYLLLIDGSGSVSKFM